MDTNKEAIKGTEKNPLAAQSFGEITRKGNILYCHIFQWPKGGKFILSGISSKVKRAWLLTNPENKSLPIQRINDKDVEITISTYPQERPVAVLAVECEDIVPAGRERLLLTNIGYNKLHVIDAALTGKKLAYAGGNWRTDYLKNWTDPEASAEWDVRNNEKATFDIYISYDAAKVSDGNKFKVTAGNKTFVKTVVEGQHQEHLYVGRVTLPEGEHKITITADGKFNGDLFMLRDIKLVAIEK
jgi:hypothetical protein